MKRGARGYAANINAVGSYNPGARKFSFVIKSVSPNKVVTITDDGQTRQLEIK
jgi:hypothetical protein